jgi:DNA-directed RNA polymerase specialized sigma24 family protein
VSEPTAEAVVLRIGHGLSYQAVAEQLGCSPGAARVRVSRALHTIHEHLDGATLQDAPAPTGGQMPRGENR